MKPNIGFVCDVAIDYGIKSSLRSTISSQLLDMPLNLYLKTSSLQKQLILCLCTAAFRLLAVQVYWMLSFCLVYVVGF